MFPVIQRSAAFLSAILIALILSACSPAPADHASTKATTATSPATAEAGPGSRIDAVSFQLAASLHDDVLQSLSVRLENQFTRRDG